MVVATGFFDGVHVGHRHVLDSLVGASRRRGEESLVVTFWPHPRNVLQDGARELRLLTSLEEKKALISAAGVDRIEVLPFTKEFSRLSTKEYLRDVIRDRFSGTAVLLGYDNRIGGDHRTAEETAAEARSLGLEVIMTERVDADGGVAVSSTRIRNCIAAGDIRGASEMLGYDYSLYGVVVGGNRLGRTIGFPTANMQMYEPLKLIPCPGVYLVEVATLGRKYFGMCNIGHKPTVGDSNPLTVETHIFDFDEDIYGLDIRVSFLRRIRDEVKFPSLEKLRAQLCIDRETCLAALGESSF